MNIGSLGCKRATIQEEQEILRVINANATIYFIKDVDMSFPNLLDVYGYCKENKVDVSAIIYNDICSWGTVKALVSKTAKEIKENFL